MVIFYYQRERNARGDVPEPHQEGCFTSRTPRPFLGTRSAADTGTGKVNCVDFLPFLWYYMSICSYSKGEAVMTKEDGLIAIDAEAVRSARAAALPEAQLLLLFEKFQALAESTRVRHIHDLEIHPM